MIYAKVIDKRKSSMLRTFKQYNVSYFQHLALLFRGRDDWLGFIYIIMVFICQKKSMDFILKLAFKHEVIKPEI